jgi:membrane protease YdiL (CAAX protease family)
MTFSAAALWSICAIAALYVFLALVVTSAGQATTLDLVSRVLCESAAFISTLLLLTLLHERERPLSDVLALRRAPAVLLVLAALGGLALQGPVNLITGPIYERYPLPQDQLDFLRQLLDVKAIHQRVAAVVAAGFVGPMVEEMFFRGAIFRGLRRVNGALRTVLGISVFFALAHLEPRNFLPDFLGGLAMGYARLASGSLWPAIVMHAAFNTCSVILALATGPDTDVFTRARTWRALSLALFAVFGRIAARSEICAIARSADMT